MTVKNIRVLKQVVKTLIIFLVMMFASPCYAADPWTKTDIALEAIYQLTCAADWLQTRYIAANPERYRELNFILGDHPSIRKVDLYFLTMGIAHCVVSHYLPKPYRSIFQVAGIVVEVDAVRHNYILGIKFEF